MCDCHLVSLDYPSDSMSSVERVIQVLLSLLWKQGQLQVKKWSQILSETRALSPTESTIQSSVQNSVGSRDSVGFTQDILL